MSVSQSEIPSNPLSSSQSVSGVSGGECHQIPPEINITPPSDEPDPVDSSVPSFQPGFVCPIHTNPPNTPNFQKKALDLFSGSGSVGQRLREWGYDVTTVDINPSAGATYTADILQWRYAKLFPPTLFRFYSSGSTLYRV